MRLFPKLRRSSLLILGIFLICGLVACTTAAQKKAQKEEATKKAKMAQLADMENDPDFLAFVGRLRQAAANHDVNMLSSMMTPNFGYRLNPVGEGDGVFQYWDQANVWPELTRILNSHFLPNGDYMVAPPAFTSGTDYHGYRAGITPVGGAWHFAYFVTD